MIDMQALREDPERVRRGAARKKIRFDVDLIEEIIVDLERIQIHCDEVEQRAQADTACNEKIIAEFECFSLCGPWGVVG